jgi:hypothetical protein
MADGKIFELIPKIMNDIGAIGKDRTNMGAQRFKFRGIDDVYNCLNKHLANHGVFSVPEKIDLISNDPITSKSGSTGWRVINKYHWRFYASDGSSFCVESIGEAIDYGDKASNKAASIAHKYAYLNVFSIPTEDDKDPDRHSHDISNEPQQNKNHETVKCNPDQRKAIFSIAKSMGWKDDEIRKMITNKYKVTSTKDLSFKDASIIIEWFKSGGI